MSTKNKEEQLITDDLFRSAVNGRSSVKAVGVEYGFKLVRSVFFGYKELESDVKKAKKVGGVLLSKEPIRYVADIVTPSDYRFNQVSSIILKQIVYGS